MSRHIQVIGFPRSGTTLMMALLHQSVSGFQIGKEEKPADHYCRLDYDTIGKRPFDTKNYDHINQLFNDKNRQINFILMVRDIRDIITSVHHDMPDDYFIGFKTTYTISGYKSGNKNGPGIEKMYESYKKFKQDPRTMIVIYQDLIRFPDYVQRYMQQILNLTMCAPFSLFPLPTVPEFYLKGNINRPIDSLSINKWKRKEHRQRIIYQFSKYPELFQILIDDGFEKNKKWFNKF